MLNLNLFMCKTFSVAWNEERCTKGRRQHVGLYSAFLLGLPTVVSVLPFVLGLVVWVGPQLYIFSQAKELDSRPDCSVDCFIALFRSRSLWGSWDKGNCLLYFWSSGGLCFSDQLLVLSVLPACVADRRGLTVVSWTSTFPPAGPRLVEHLVSRLAFFVGHLNT